MRNLKLTMAALAALTLGACSDDSKEAEEPINPSVTESTYFNVTIMANGGSRAVSDEGFEESTDESKENYINNLLLIFYDANGNYMTYATIQNAEMTAANSTGNVEKIYTVTASIKLPKGTALPEQVLCFANPINAANLIGSTTMDAVRDEFRSQIKGNNGSSDYFAMNNSVYLKQRSAGGMWDRVDAVKLDKNMFFATEADAKNSAASIEIYLERVAAKVTLVSTDNNTSVIPSDVIEMPTKDGKTMQLKFVVTGWGLTCLEKKFYLLKHFSTNDDALSHVLSIDNATKEKYDNDLWTGWNDPDNHRSYWAHSAAYVSQNLPTVADDLGTPLPGFTSATQGINVTSKDGYDLRYLSYNAMTTEPGLTNHIYELENTVSKNLYNVRSALPTLVVKGYYVYSMNNTRCGDLYKFGENMYKKDDMMSIWMLESLKNIIKVKDDEAEGGFRDIIYTEEDKTVLDDFVVVHPTYSFNNDKVKVPGNRVTLNLTADAAKSGKYYYQTGAETATQITATNLDDINKKIYEACGVAEIYKDGMAYYTAPIRHLGRDIPTDEKDAEGNVITTKGTGYYGLVRNHHYLLQLDKITGLGRGVFRPGDPIVPNDDNTEWYFNLKINVLSWKLIKQDVVLDPHS